jgi:hypothetical protein
MLPPITIPGLAAAQAEADAQERADTQRHAAAQARAVEEANPHDAKACACDTCTIARLDP